MEPRKCLRDVLDHVIPVTQPEGHTRVTDVSQITFESIRSRLARRDPHRPSPEGRGEAAVALVLVHGHAGPDLLLIERARRKGDPWSGQMGLPGGRREDRDQDLLATARRETLEETGIDLPAAALLGELDDLAPTIPVLPPVIVRPYVFGLERRPDVTPSHEVASSIWVPLSRLPALEDLTDVQVRGARHRVSAFLVERYVVWGMTHRILKPFIELVI